MLSKDSTTQSGDISLIAGTNVGTGYIYLTSRALGGYLILANIPTSGVGLPTGAFWKI